MEPLRRTNAEKAVSGEAYLREVMGNLIEDSTALDRALELLRMVWHITEVRGTMDSKERGEVKDF